MTTRYSCWLDGQGLQDIDPTIFIVDIAETAPKTRVNSAARAKGDGLRVLRRTRQSLSVTVSFAIREYDVARRKGVMEKIAAWAHDGWLTINDRPEGKLWVTVDALPTVTSAMKWTDTLSIVLTAYGVPYWLSEWPAQASVANAASTGKVSLTASPGAVQAFLEVRAINRGGGTLGSFSARAGESSMDFNGLQIAPGGELSIRYDEDGLLWLPASCRTGESSDDLLLTPGKPSEISYTADQPVTVSFTARELFA